MFDLEKKEELKRRLSKEKKRVRALERIAAEKEELLSRRLREREKKSRKRSDSKERKLSKQLVKEALREREHRRSKHESDSESDSEDDDINDRSANAPRKKSGYLVSGITKKKDPDISVEDCPGYKPDPVFGAIGKCAICAGDEREHGKKSRSSRDRHGRKSRGRVKDSGSSRAQSRSRSIASLMSDPNLRATKGIVLSDGSFNAGEKSKRIEKKKRRSRSKSLKALRRK